MLTPYKLSVCRMPVLSLLQSWFPVNINGKHIIPHICDLSYGENNDNPTGGCTSLPILFTKECDVGCSLIRGIPVSWRYVVFVDAKSHQPQSRLKLACKYIHHMPKKLVISLKNVHPLGKSDYSLK